MPIEYSDAEKAALESQFCSFAGLLRVATPVPVRLWTGIGDFAVINSAFDPDGSLFRGSRIITLPTFQRIWNGLAERVTITLSGVTDELKALIYEEADDVRGAIVRMGLALLDTDTHRTGPEQIGPLRWMRRGRVDVIETDNKPGERQRIKTIAFSLGSQLTGRRVPGAGTWTNADQQSRPGSSDDRGCERTPLMTESAPVKWPNF